MKRAAYPPNPSRPVVPALSRRGRNDDSDFSVARRQRIREICARTRAAQKAIDKFCGDHSPRVAPYAPSPKRVEALAKRACRLCGVEDHTFAQCPELRRSAERVERKKDAKKHEPQEPKRAMGGFMWRGQWRGDKEKL
jgi:hypothetical protein